jgi:hypothetical protein
VHTKYATLQREIDATQRATIAREKPLNTRRLRVMMLRNIKVSMMANDGK